MTRRGACGDRGQPFSRLPGSSALSIFLYQTWASPLLPAPFRLPGESAELPLRSSLKPLPPLQCSPVGFLSRSTNICFRRSTRPLVASRWTVKSDFSVGLLAPSARLGKAFTSRFSALYISLSSSTKTSSMPLNPSFHSRKYSKSVARLGDESPSRMEPKWALGYYWFR